MTTADTVNGLLQELRDLKAGISSHGHTSSDGTQWRCTSPYCPSGGTVQDKPWPGPGESAEQAERYRRVYA